MGEDKNMEYTDLPVDEKPQPRGGSWAHQNSRWLVPVASACVGACLALAVAVPLAEMNLPVPATASVSQVDLDWSDKSLGWEEKPEEFDTEMVKLMEERGLEAEDVVKHLTCTSSGSTHPSTVNSSLTVADAASLSTASTTDMRTLFGGADDGPRPGRQLQSVSEIITIGQMIGATWEALRGDGTSINTNRWTGAVPREFENNWSGLGGWRTVSWTPWDFTPQDQCRNGFGNNVGSMSFVVHFEHNGQFVTNAKAIVTGHTLWGYTLTADVEVGSPTNIGTVSRPVSQVTLFLKAKLSTVLKSSSVHYTFQVRGDGSSSASSVGALC